MCLLAGSSVQAHDETVDNVVFTGVGMGAAQEIEHWDDGQPWDDYKGWINVNCTNNSGVVWADFHFEIYVVQNGVENVIIEYTSPYLPWCSQNGMTYDVDNSPTTGATLAMQFDDDRVGIGESADFHMYTDNMTDHLPCFGVRFWPTPVPEPSSLFMAAGLGMLLLSRRR